MSGSRLHRRFGSVPGLQASDLVHLTPADAGWEWTGIRVVALAPGVPVTVETGDAEAFVLPLSGSLHVDVAAESFELAGRDSVFARVTDFAYVGRDSTVTLVSESGADVALPSSRCERRLPPRYGPAEQVAVEIRGSGAATRQVTNFGAPGEWDHADKLVCCEVITPPGNWSSYPAHKHDASAPCPVVNEEIYLYRISGPDQVTPSPVGFGYHRTYTGAEHSAGGLAVLDETIEVRDLDVVLVPYGYHGPCIAPPDYAMYYLNVMAGPAAERSMSVCDDPAHTWIRGAWNERALDPRVPVTSARGRVQ